MVLFFLGQAPEGRDFEREGRADGQYWSNDRWTKILRDRRGMCYVLLRIWLHHLDNGVVVVR